MLGWSRQIFRHTLVALVHTEDSPRSPQARKGPGFGSASANNMPMQETHYSYFSRRLPSENPEPYPQNQYRGS